MSGSIPHTIALSNLSSANVTTPGYTTYDLRSDEDTRSAANNALNARATSDLIVTLSEEAQALLKQDKKNIERQQAEENNPSRDIDSDGESILKKDF
ncbi:hypothetical protein [Marinomonas algarum]|uniref:Uncharacterized protein n=1 Tax=Marinomonas algarum TaxID=2883105 RepID=A0A9X1INP2_9GAMM|nr:hypothetical protein [Marinomonas algarum]MCB5162774.1 hypothetical protein [Marinomonas algarum]